MIPIPTQIDNPTHSNRVIKMANQWEKNLVSKWGYNLITTTVADAVVLILAKIPKEQKVGSVKYSEQDLECIRRNKLYWIEWCTQATLSKEAPKGSLHLTFDNGLDVVFIDQPNPTSFCMTMEHGGKSIVMHETEEDFYLWLTRYF